MRTTFLLLMLIASASALCDCAGQAAPTDASTVPPDATSRVSEEDVFCSTQDEQAWQHYVDAGELERQGRLEEAQEHYQQAIELDPGFCDAMDNLGRSLRSQGRLDEAIYWYKESIKVLPENRVAHQNLALAYRLQGRVSDAIEEYQLLVLLEPDNPEGYYGLAGSYLESGQPHNAVIEGKKAEALYRQESSPLVTDAHHLLAIAYIQLDDCKNALNFLELVHPEMEDDPGVNYFLGMCHLIETQDAELAWRYLEKAQELGVEISPEVLRALGK